NIGTGGSVTIRDAGHETSLVDSGSGGPTSGPGRGPLVGVWVGQVSHTITSIDDNGPEAPPEHVVLVVEESDGGVSGSIVFGEGQPPPRATEPSIFYPPVTPSTDIAEQYAQYTDLIANPYDGQPYSLFHVHRTATRLGF